ncbi:UNVERIFIED_CONTAM: transmembrane and coiled-coil domains-containing protein 7 [Siphonaria sp. JEL0065]|nr:transmembrane and coiled-coil domains-containing protein 7 [Siphonaria sp. JEL0065]
MGVKELLKDLLRLNSVAKTQLLLSQMVLFQGESRSGNVPVCRVGDGGGVLFVRIHKEEGGDLLSYFYLFFDSLLRNGFRSAIQNPEAFVEFLVSLENNDLTCGVFLDLLEEYIKSSSVKTDGEDSGDLGNLTLIQILMILIERFGANLITGTRRMIELVKSIVVNSNSVDSGCLLLCLTIFKSVLSSIEDPTVDIRQLFELNELLIVLQTLETHEDLGIRNVAKDVRRLILIKSGNIPTDSDAEKRSSELLFAKSMLELGDELLPLRAHGIDQISKMVLGRDPIAYENLTTIICSFLDMLQDVDSFIYLHAVTGLSSLTDVYPRESLHEIVSRYSNSELELDYRLRIGEVAAKTIQRSGPMFPKYAPEILPQILRVLHDSNHKELRGSSISLLSVIAETAPLPLLPFIHQILDYIENTLILESKDAVMRQGAVLAMLSLARGMDGMYSSFPRGTLKKIVTRLRIVREMDGDELTRWNAGVAVDELVDRAGVLAVEFL